MNDFITPDFLVTDFLIKLFYAFVTLAFLAIVARLADKLVGFNFKTEFQKVRDDAKALAIYLAGRAVAIALIVSSFF